MKRIEAIIQPHKLDEVKEALHGIGVERRTIADVRGHGRQKGHTETYRGNEYKLNLLPTVKLDMVVPDARARQMVAALTKPREPRRSGIRSGEQGEGIL